MAGNAAQMLGPGSARQRSSAATEEVRSSVKARMIGVATATPPTSYSQAELLDTFRITDRRVRSIFTSGGIERRYLTLPPAGPDGTPATETQGELLGKHRTQAFDMGARAILGCLRDAGADPCEIGYLCCVTTTGFLTPGLSAWLFKELGLDVRASRLDVVGMGCNAGLNALSAVAGWAIAHPGRLAIMLCVEVCSAAYVFDGTMRTSVVNSLFGDGAAAVAVVAGTAGSSGTAQAGATLLRFASRIIPEAVEAMRYDWDDEQGKFSFFLDRDVPYVVGANAEEVVDRLLAGTGLRRSGISHWTVHSGGRKVIDSVQVNLGLTRYDLRHTTGVLRDYGNISSASFLFSYERLRAERTIRAGDLGVLMTMGPGSSIETALVRY